MSVKHLAVGLSILVLAGCSKLEVVTELNADGSYERTLSFEVADDPMGKKKKVGDVFTVPAEGWKVETKRKKDKTLITAKKSFKAGQSSSLTPVLLGEKAKMSTSCSVKRSGKTLEYREEIRWIGEKGDTFADMDAKDMAELLKALPKGIATPADAKAVGEAMANKLIRILYGPKEPLLPGFLLHPDYTMRRFKHRLGKGLDRVLKKHFKKRLSKTQRLATVRKLMATIEKDMDSKKEESKKKAGPGGGPPGPGGKKEKKKEIVPLSFVLKVPMGAKVETNGVYNAIAGEIYWAFYPEAASMEPLVLKATVTLR